jgi:hypothetical protein
MGSWFRKPVNIVITVIAGLMAVAAVVLVIWGVTHHEEGGLLEVCWGEDGRAHYVEGIEGETRPCEGPQELVWPQEQIPLTIAPVSAEGEPLGADTPQVRVLGQAITNLNRQVGFELLRLGSGLQPSDAEVRFGGAFQAGEGGASPSPGYVSHLRVGGTGQLRAHVYIRSDVESVDALLHGVLLHELLHVVGLEHDDFRLSLMYPRTADDWEAAYAVSTAHVTDYDIGLLRRYRQ